MRRSGPERPAIHERPQLRLELAEPRVERRLGVDRDLELAPVAAALEHPHPARMRPTSPRPTAARAIVANLAPRRRAAPARPPAGRAASGTRRAPPRRR